ncbi:MAG: 4-hydroxy-tetrahydrodipicolinate synthase [Gammaproteobacteria bacterium]|nr:4-hydroxy-tetrahydrodipicolinate synthase [Gammaproteobacteria bacterium]
MIRGSIVALATPMFDDGQVDFDALSNLVEMHVDAGTNAIVAVGTTGESATLDNEEHVAVIRFVVEQAAKRIAVIGGTGANSTREAIELTNAAKGAGVDACLLVSPYYNKPTQEGLFQHHKAIAEAVAIPQMLYNVPGRTAVDMAEDTVDRLADVDNIVAIKDATGDIPRGRALIARVADRIDVLSGDDETFVDLLLAGGKGNISVTANVAPAQMRAICDAAMAGDADQANSINAGIQHLHTQLFCESNPIPVKWALHQMGKMGQGIRLPLTPLSEGLRADLQAGLNQAGLLSD